MHLKRKNRKKTRKKNTYKKKEQTYYTLNLLPHCLSLLFLPCKLKTFFSFKKKKCIKNNISPPFTIIGDVATPLWG